MNLCVLTITKAPGRTSTSTGAKNFGKMVGKMMTVVTQDSVRSELTAVVSGTPLNAVHAQITVTCRRTLSSPLTIAP